MNKLLAESEWAPGNLGKRRCAIVNAASGPPEGQADFVLLRRQNWSP
ncbi:MAG TPA: hypothetical protein VH374_08505 [Polyangia bacterium]|jgi:hypothetical protein|nr:hypothetical protein [Polyangia bacterium]